MKMKPWEAAMAKGGDIAFGMIFGSALCESPSTFTSKCLVAGGAVTCVLVMWIAYSDAKKALKK
jgi:hypothetical protein